MTYATHSNAPGISHHSSIHKSHYGTGQMPHAFNLLPLEKVFLRLACLLSCL